MADNNRKLGDQISVIGGADLPADLFDVQDFPADVPTDDLSQQLFWLQKMNPGVVKFRNSDLVAMDDDTKRAMIADIQYALGLGPLKDCVS